MRHFWEALFRPAHVQGPPKSVDALVGARVCRSGPQMESTEGLQLVSSKSNLSCRVDQIWP